MSNVMSVIKEYILAEFLPGENPDALKPDTALMSSGVLDSLATVRLIQFLDERYGVLIEPHEMTADYLNTLEQITELIESRL